MSNFDTFEVQRFYSQELAKIATNKNEQKSQY